MITLLEKSGREMRKKKREREKERGRSRKIWQVTKCILEYALNWGMKELGETEKIKKKYQR